MKTLLLIAALLTVPFLTAQTVDQQQLGYTGGTSQRAFPDYCSYQTFVPSRTGTLTKVDIAFFNGVTNGSLLVRILSGDPAHVPFPAVIWSQTYTVNTPKPYGWASFPMTVSLNAGQTYCVIFSAVNMPDPYGVCMNTTGYPAGSYGYTYELSGRGYVWETGWALTFRTWMQ